MKFNIIITGTEHFTDSKILNKPITIPTLSSEVVIRLVPALKNNEPLPDELRNIVEVGIIPYEVANFFDPGVIGVDADDAQMEKLLAGAINEVFENKYKPVSGETIVVPIAQLDRELEQHQRRIAKLLAEVTNGYTPLTLSGNEKYAVGVDLGGVTIGFIVIRMSDGKELISSEVKTPKTPDGKRAPKDPVREKIVEQIQLIQQQLLEDKGIDIRGKCVIGVGVPGPVFSERGVIEQLTNFDESWDSCYIKKELEEKLDAPVYADNDANVAARAIAIISGMKTFIVLTLGTGIGGGIVMNGEVYHGIKGAGELGHFIVDTSPDARRCGCDNRGCLEAYASALNIGIIAKERVQADRRKGAQIFQMADGDWAQIDAMAVGKAALRHNDPLAHEILREMGANLAKAMKKIYEVSGIPIFTFVGNMATLRETVPTGSLVNKYTEKALAEIYGKTKAPIEMRPILEKLDGPNAGRLGAALLAASMVEKNKDG